MGIDFTPQQIRSLRATSSRQEIRDLGCKNLYVVVQPRTGEKSFVMRVTIDGKQRKKTLGHFPSLSLADARDMAREVKIAVRRKKPPPVSIGPQRASQEASTGLTVSDAWHLYWQHEASARKSAGEKRRIFRKEVEPTLGSKLLSEVSRDELASLIAAKFATAKTASNRLHSFLARFFKWCFTQGQSLTKLESNPMASVVKMHSERDSARKRYFSKQEISWWFEALPKAGVYAPIHNLLMRTLVRFSDIMELKWGEVTQRENGDWVLELADTKSGEPHVVYLHPTAASLLPHRPSSAKPADRVFAVKSRSAKPVDRIRKEMERLAAEEGLNVPHWQPHDYRRTGTTHLAEMTDAEDNPLVGDHVLDRVLAHKEQRVIRHYNKYGYYREKKAALGLWNDFLDRLLRQSPPRRRLVTLRVKSIT